MAQDSSKGFKNLSEKEIVKSKEIYSLYGAIISAIKARYGNSVIGENDNKSSSLAELLRLDSNNEATNELINKSKEIATLFSTLLEKSHVGYTSPIIETDDKTGKDILVEFYNRAVLAKNDIQNKLGCTGGGCGYGCASTCSNNCEDDCV